MMNERAKEEEKHLKCVEKEAKRQRYLCNKKLANGLNHSKAFKQKNQETYTNGTIRAIFCGVSIHLHAVVNSFFLRTLMLA